MSDSLLLGVVVHDDLLFAFPRIDSQAGGAACSSSWGMQIASLVGLQFYPAMNWPVTGALVTSERLGSLVFARGVPIL